jgi:hypothetical protein
MADAPKPKLTLPRLLQSAHVFAHAMNAGLEEVAPGTKTTGKKLEELFLKDWLDAEFTYTKGNRASGVDIPSLNVDLKTSDTKKLQGDSPKANAAEKFYGLSYSLLLFPQKKRADGRYEFMQPVHIPRECTSDKDATTRLSQLLDGGASLRELRAFLFGFDLGLSDVEASELAKRFLQERPPIGWLGLSRLDRWRVRYGQSLVQPLQPLAA